MFSNVVEYGRLALQGWGALYSRLSVTLSEALSDYLSDSFLRLLDVVFGSGWRDITFLGLFLGASVYLIVIALVVKFVKSVILP